MFRLKRAVVNGLLFAAFAVTPLGVGALTAGTMNSNDDPAIPLEERAMPVEKTGARFSFGVYGGRPSYYGRGYGYRRGYGRGYGYRRGYGGGYGRRYGYYGRPYYPSPYYSPARPYWYYHRW